MLYIDPDNCIDCGACEPECPVEAIFCEDDLPAKRQTALELNAGMVKVYPSISESIERDN